MSASDALDLYTLPPNDLLTTEQVGQLGTFGRAATLEQNRCTGRPGPRFLKVGARIFYRVSALTAYLAEQEAASEHVQVARQARFQANRRGAKMAPGVTVGVQAK
ncbi:MAG: hypothetical protein ACRYGP_17525 [Janthinobacterium lividum]